MILIVFYVLSELLPLMRSLNQKLEYLNQGLQVKLWTLWQLIFVCAKKRARVLVLPN